MIVKPFDKCPICNGEMASKIIEKLLRGGNNTATLLVQAEICLSCGEKLFSEETVKRFQYIREQLTSGQVAEFEPMGQAFRVA